MGPTQQYYKPWRIVEGPPLIDYSGQTSASGSFTVNVTPQDLGVTSLTNGIYYFEIRMIGHRAIYPISVEYTVAALPTPTPTTTPTPTPPIPTPTPTPTPGPSIYTSGATLNVTDTGWIKYTNNSGSTTYQQLTTLGTNTLTACLDCSTINIGIPFADLATFTITNCGSTCGGVPGPTPTPTATGGVGSNFRCNITIQVLSHPNPAAYKGSASTSQDANTPYDQHTSLRFKVYNAWITSLSYSGLDAGSNTLMVEEMTVVHEGWDVRYATDYTEAGTAPTKFDTNQTIA
jgi:hypothetical protein